MNEMTQLADRTLRWQTARRTGADRTTPALDPKLTGLVSESVGITSPAWERLTQITQRTTAE